MRERDRQEENERQQGGKSTRNDKRTAMSKWMKENKERKNVLGSVNDLCQQTFAG